MSTPILSPASPAGKSSEIFHALTPEDAAIASSRMSRAQIRAYHTASLYDCAIAKHQIRERVEHGFTALDLIKLRYLICKRDVLLDHKLGVY